MVERALKSSKQIQTQQFLGTSCSASMDGMGDEQQTWDGGHFPGGADGGHCSPRALQSVMGLSTEYLCVLLRQKDTCSTDSAQVIWRAKNLCTFPALVCTRSVTESLLNISMIHRKSKKWPFFFKKKKKISLIESVSFTCSKIHLFQVYNSVNSQARSQVTTTTIKT